MFITFPGDEKVKARLDAVCKSLGITYQEWFDTALKESEFDVLVRFMDNPEDQTEWMWDETLCRFVRRSEVE
ncbi:hypothetical protein [Desulfitobacterium metallireducens]|uniref:Uncharacterized protein n=1 Tax=Desulfitobacterium metallireducens DSM 15288 TaxID=871968 RepID=W0EDQ2_9FIRM|nr:hypothetical protein [Desulfitobacterium metallireducens]AHF07176.1 hypothetical protein DESME_09035 [Desulfitobacterium metallireducens DSM 15288]